MLIFEFNMPRGIKESKFYHEWDLDNDVVAWENINITSKGKYVKFDDGSDLYAKIINCSTKVVNTSSGMYRIADVVHCSVPKINNTTVYGVRSSHVHPVVAPYTVWERKAARELITTGETGYKVTRRIRMRAQEILGEEAIRQGLTKEVFIARMVQEFNIREGRNFPVAAKFLGLAVFNVDITKPEIEDGEQENLPIMQRDTMALYAPRTEGNRIATINDLKKLIKVTKMQEATFSEKVEADIEDGDIPV